MDKLYRNVILTFTIEMKVVIHFLLSNLIPKVCFQLVNLPSSHVSLVIFSLSTTKKVLDVQFLGLKYNFHEKKKMKEMTKTYSYLDTKCRYYISI